MNVRAVAKGNRGYVVNKIKLNKGGQRSVVETDKGQGE
jgi:hypothetical protein